MPVETLRPNDQGPEDLVNTFRNAVRRFAGELESSRTFDEEPFGTGVQLGLRRLLRDAAYYSAVSTLIATLPVEAVLTRTTLAGLLHQLNQDFGIKEKSGNQGPQVTAK